MMTRFLFEYLLNLETNKLPLIGIMRVINTFKFLIFGSSNVDIVVVLFFKIRCIFLFPLFGFLLND